MSTAQRTTRQELLALRGVDRDVIDEIEAWLRRRGKGFHPDPPPLGAALAQALGHLEALLSGHQDASFEAFVALPDLHRSLAVYGSKSLYR